MEHDAKRERDRILYIAVMVMMRAICGVKLVHMRMTENLRLSFGMEKTIGHLAKSNSVRWHGHALRKALDFTVR